jgi:hypothetical protein
MAKQSDSTLRFEYPEPAAQHRSGGHQGRKQVKIKPFHFATTLASSS